MSHVSFQKQNLAEQVADQLSQTIAERGWSSGRKLPPVRDLAKLFDVSPNTAHSAIQLLAKRGVVDLQPRQGAFIQETYAKPEERSGPRNQVGIILPCHVSAGYDFMHDDWQGRIMKSAELELHESGYYTTILGYYESAELHGRIEPMRSYLGGVLTFAWPAMEPVLQTLDQWNIPWVTINAPSRRSTHNFVTAANQADCAEFGRAVAQAGLTRVWILVPNRSATTMMDKILGFYEGFFQVRASTQDIEILDCDDYLEPSGYEAVQHRLEQSAPPQLIFALGDFMALGAMRACRQKNIRIPQEVGIVGGTGLKIAELAHPSLSVVAQPMEEIGRQAAQMLVSMAREGITRLIGRRISGQFVARESFSIGNMSLSPENVSSLSRSNALQRSMS